MKNPMREQWWQTWQKQGSFTNLSRRKSFRGKEKRILIIR